MTRKAMCAVLAILLILFSVVQVLAVSLNEPVCATPYDKETNYFELMYKCAVDGSPEALKNGAEYERLRNLKIDGLGMNLQKTSYFATWHTGRDILISMKAERLKSEHRAAGEVYEYLSRHGYTDPVIAGILGNMMAECGGQTLDLRWWIYDGSGAYYGLCMWSLRYSPAVRGRDITGQMNYLAGNIRQIMSQFGGSHSYFMSIQDAGEAARYFCTYYERGAGARVRANNAYAALRWIS